MAATKLAAGRRTVPTFSSQFRERELDLETTLKSMLIGQDDVLDQIIPYVEAFKTGLSIPGRPAGVFMLLGPTGTGKTKTVEMLAKAEHGSEKNLLRIDCAEFQLDHEVAKLIGAPPGYLGHRETVPVITQAKLTAITSEKSELSIVLFDEIEKAADGLKRLLLGILDKGTLRLGDGSVVDFENSLVFFTSNLGAAQIQRELNPNFGFSSLSKPNAGTDLHRKLEQVSINAMKKEFSPEFINRLDVVAMYKTLQQEQIEAILDIELRAIQDHINKKLAHRAFGIDVDDDVKAFLIKEGISPEYGARELKRVIVKEILHKISHLSSKNTISPGAVVRISMAGSKPVFVVEKHSSYNDGIFLTPSLLAMA